MVTITSEDAKRRKILKTEAALTQILNDAARGNLRALQFIIKLLLLLPTDDDEKLTFIIEG